MLEEKIQLETEFSDEQLLMICENAGVIACECPSYLVHLLQQVRVFRNYTTDCVEQFPEDTVIHEWLSGRASQLETMLTQTILEFLRKENLINEDNQLSLQQLAERSRASALRRVSL